jgi:hypothetical protein
MARGSSDYKSVSKVAYAVRFDKQEFANLMDELEAVSDRMLEDLPF